MPKIFTLVSPFEAQTRFTSQLPAPALAAETFKTEASLGRVTAAAVYAPQPLPEFPRSTMDGYAVRAVDTLAALENLPVRLRAVEEVPMGNAPAFTLQPGSAATIHTGGMLPEGADAVVMLEQTRHTRPGEVEVLRSVSPGENVVARGADVKQGQEIIPPGRRIRPVEIGGLLALGVLETAVVRQPRIGILSSGDEIVPPSVRPQPGQVRDINTYTLSTLIEEGGGEALSFGIAPDQPGRLAELAAAAFAQTDALVFTAGSSASVRDLTAEVIDGLGEPGILVHGIHIRPGKPTILAVCNGKPVIGLPGNPVSAYVIARLFLLPLLDHLQGVPPPPGRPFVLAELATGVPSPAGREDWVPVQLRSQQGKIQAEPVFFNSSLIFNLVQADGLMCIPQDTTIVNAGETVRVYSL